MKLKSKIYIDKILGIPAVFFPMSLSFPTIIPEEKESG
jgi:hypothetical protein